MRWYGTSSPALQAAARSSQADDRSLRAAAAVRGGASTCRPKGPDRGMLYPTQIPRLKRLARARWTDCGNGANTMIGRDFDDTAHRDRDADAGSGDRRTLSPSRSSAVATVKKRAETRRSSRWTASSHSWQRSTTPRTTRHGVEPERRSHLVSAFRTPPAQRRRLLRLSAGGRGGAGVDRWRLKGDAADGCGAAAWSACRVDARLRPLVHACGVCSMRFDERLGPAYPLLYARALARGVGERWRQRPRACLRVGVDEATVATWRRGEHRPQQDDVLFEVLKLSGLEPAWTNRKKIREYLATVRGPTARSRRSSTRLSSRRSSNSATARASSSSSSASTWTPSSARCRCSRLPVSPTRAMTSRASAIGQFLTVDHPLVREAA